MSFSQLLPDFTALAVQLVPEGRRRVYRLFDRAQRALPRVATEVGRLPWRVGHVASRVSLRYIGAHTVGRLDDGVDSSEGWSCDRHHRAMTNATVTTKTMRLISATSL